MCSLKLKQHFKEMPLRQVVLGCVPKSPRAHMRAPSSAFRHTWGESSQSTALLHCLQWPCLGLQDQGETPLWAFSVLEDMVLGHFAENSLSLLPRPPPTACEPALNRQLLNVYSVPTTLCAGVGVVTERSLVHSSQSIVHALYGLPFPSWTGPRPLAMAQPKYVFLHEQHAFLLSVSYSTQGTLPLLFSCGLRPMYTLSFSPTGR